MKEKINSIRRKLSLFPLMAIFIPTKSYGFWQFLFTLAIKVLPKLIRSTRTISKGVKRKKRKKGRINAFSSKGIGIHRSNVTRTRNRSLSSTDKIFLKDKTIISINRIESLSNNDRKRLLGNIMDYIEYADQLMSIRDAIHLIDRWKREDSFVDCRAHISECEVCTDCYNNITKNTELYYE